MTAVFKAVQGREDAPTKLKTLRLSNTPTADPQIKFLLESNPDLKTVALLGGTLSNSKIFDALSVQPTKRKKRLCPHLERLEVGYEGVKRSQPDTIQPAIEAMVEARRKGTSLSYVEYNGWYNLMDKDATKRVRKASVGFYGDDGASISRWLDPEEEFYDLMMSTQGMFDFDESDDSFDYF